MQIRELKPVNEQLIYTLDINPGSEQLVLGQQGDDSGNPRLSLWALEELRMLRAIDSERYGLIRAARFSPDGKKLAYINGNMALHIYNLETQEKRTPELAGQYVKWLAYARRAERFVTAGSSTQVWDAAQLRVIWQPEGQTPPTDRSEPPGTASLSPDGKRVAVAGLKPGRIEVFDVETGRTLQSLEGAPDAVRWVSYCPRERYLAAIDWYARGTHLWDLSTGGKHLPKIFKAQSGSFWSLSFHPDDELLAIGMLTGFVLLVSLTDGALVFHQRLHNGRVHDIAFSPDGKRLVSGGEDGVACVCDLDAPES